MESHPSVNGNELSRAQSGLSCGFLQTQDKHTGHRGGCH